MSRAPLPTLVLMPGMDGTGSLFAPFLEALPPDLPTRVLSYPPDLALGYEALEAIARAQLPQGDLVLLGESFSGPLAVALAAALGPRVRGLVLCCTFVRSPSAFLRFIRPLTRWVPVEATPRRVLFRALLDPDGPPALRPLLLDAMAQVAPRALRERLHAMAGVDARAALASCRSPVLYLQARRDRLVPPACGDVVLAVRPDATRLVLDGPHGLLQTSSTLCARAVVDFVRAAHLGTGGQATSQRVGAAARHLHGHPVYGRPCFASTFLCWLAGVRVAPVYPDFGCGLVAAVLDGYSLTGAQSANRTVECSGMNGLVPVTV